MELFRHAVLGADKFSPDVAGPHFLSAANPVREDRDIFTSLAQFFDLHWTSIYLILKNLVLPPGRRPYGPEAGPVEDPAIRGSESDGFAVKDNELFWSTGVLEYWSVEKAKTLISTLRSY